MKIKKKKNFLSVKNKTKNHLTIFQSQVFATQSCDCNITMF